MSTRLYGFGSYFQGNQRPHDIDLLIVHTDLSEKSIYSAIAIKRALLVCIPAAHIVMLSEPEERELAFIERSKAKLLGSVYKLPRGNPFVFYSA